MSKKNKPTTRLVYRCAFCRFHYAFLRFGTFWERFAAAHSFPKRQPRERGRDGEASGHGHPHGRPAVPTAGGPRGICSARTIRRTRPCHSPNTATVTCFCTIAIVAEGRRDKLIGVGHLRRLHKRLSAQWVQKATEGTTSTTTWS